jgi:hypothetical protein
MESGSLQLLWTFQKTALRNPSRCHSSTTNHARRGFRWWENAITAELAQLKAKNTWTEVDHSSAIDQILLGTVGVRVQKRYGPDDRQTLPQV